MSNSAINKLKKDFLYELITHGGKWLWTLDGLERRLKTNRATIVHVAHLLEDEHKIIVKGQEIPTKMTYEITSVGRQEFDPFCTKAWRFFTNDLAKILSVISLVLSIVATATALSK